MLSHTQQLKIYNLKDGFLSANEFESWIYSDTCLENSMGAEPYLDLISLDYQKNGATYEALKILEPYISEPQYLEWNLKELMRAIIERPVDVHIPIARTYDLYCKGYDFLRKMGLEFGLKVAAPPPYYDGYDKLSLQELHKLIDSFYPTITLDAQRVLGCLNNKKIEIISWDERWLDYVDNRTLKEKESMNTKVINMNNFFVRVAWKWFGIPIYTYDLNRQKNLDDTW